MNFWDYDMVALPVLVVNVIFTLASEEYCVVSQTILDCFTKLNLNMIITKLMNFGEK